MTLISLAVDPEDHQAFKIEAATRGIPMKVLFHEVVESRKKPKPPVVKSP